ncbi:hypothetical protein ADM96_33625 [Burkholderia sp. ST111]|nr:hypothetical protein ADM96_33625 [Burkholderia sp. ST111]
MTSDGTPDAVIMEGNEIRLFRGLRFGQWIVRAFCEGTMTSNFEPTVMPGGESAGLFDSACNRLREITKARCVAVIVIDGELGSGYSVMGPLEAQVLLPDILQKMADTLRGQLSKNLQ